MTWKTCHPPTSMPQFPSGVEFDWLISRVAVQIKYRLRTLC